MQMISKNTLSQIFKEHNIEVDRISKIRTLQTLLNDTTLDIPLMRRVVTTINCHWISQCFTLKFQKRLVRCEIVAHGFQTTGYVSMPSNCGKTLLV